MTINLGQIELDDELALRQFKQDLRDDWFPDPRRYEDIFSASLAQKLIDENIRRNNGVYRPERRHALNIPKANFTLRCALETSVTDRLVYHALAASLTPFYDPLMPWQAMSHRYNAGGKADKHLFKNGVSAWMDFINCCRTSLGETSALLSTDLSNYFENIDISALERRMRELIPQLVATDEERDGIDKRLNLLFECLSSWTYEEGFGLPQNRDASSFLANVYMLALDKAMLQKGYKYFRYMDDIKIVCDDVFQARFALKELSIELREIGLSINSKKTEICGPDERGKIDACLETTSPELLELDSMWKTKKISVIAKSFTALRDLTIEQLKTKNVDSREFRFCISRLETLAFCEEFAVPDEYFSEITPLVVDAFPDHPASTDQLVRYLRAVTVPNEQLARVGAHLMNPKLSIYKWQNYRLWILLAQKGYVSDQLVEFASNLVSGGEDTPTRAGATMYLGVVGGAAGRELIAGNFQTLTTFLGQRSALLAVQELDYKDHIEGPVRPHVREDLRNVYRGLGRSGIYFAPPERRSITWINDIERSYE